MITKALKVLPKKLFSIESDEKDEFRKKYRHDTDLKRKAENEIRVHSIFQSGYILRLHNWFKDSESYYLILEYMQKGDLGDEISKHPRGLGIERIRKMGLQIAYGIDTIHLKKVVHRDIKPQNILLTDDD